MKIICVSSLLDDACGIIYTKPDTTLHHPELPLYWPEHTPALSLSVGLGVKITKQGKCIAPRFAHKYYEQVVLGGHFTDSQRLESNQKKGLPWDTAVSFDSSTLLGHFAPVSSLGEEWSFPCVCLTKNDFLAQISHAIAQVSSYFTLRTGDVVFLLSHTTIELQKNTPYRFDCSPLSLEIQLK